MPWGKSSAIGSKTLRIEIKSEDMTAKRTKSVMDLYRQYDLILGNNRELIGGRGMTKARFYRLAQAMKAYINNIERRLNVHIIDASEVQVNLQFTRMQYMGLESRQYA